MKPRWLTGTAATLLVLSAALALPFLTGCNGNSQTTSPQVICTTPIVKDIVKNVAGGRLTVDSLMSQDADPHKFTPEPGDAAKLDNARIVFASGLKLENSSLREVLDKMALDKPVVAVTRTLDPKDQLREGDQPDPHVWHDVRIWIKATGVVCEELCKFDPAGAEFYKANARAHKEKLAKLHEYAKKELATIPKERRVLVTAHDAFEYFGRAYDLEVKGLQGINTKAEASVNDVNELVNFIAGRKIKAIFVESSVNPKNIESLREGCARRNPPHQVAVGGMLYSDTLGAENSPAGTYEGMIRHNVDTIVKALK